MTSEKLWAAWLRKHPAMVDGGAFDGANLRRFFELAYRGGFEEGTKKMAEKAQRADDIPDFLRGIFERRNG